MFNFLKRLFKEKETEETVEQDQLVFWLDRKFKEKARHLEKDAGLFFGELESKKRVLSERLSELEKAEIKDPDKIEDRIKNLVAGHRDNYLRVLRIFLNEIKIPEQKTLDEAVKLSSFLKEKLDEVAKSTAKSYAASQHLFFNEVEAISKVLKGFFDMVGGFEKMVEKNKLKEMEQIKKLIDSLGKLDDEREKLSESLEMKKANLQNLWANKKKKQDEIQGLEEGDEYKAYLELKEKKESIESQIRENQSEFLQLFAQIERALRKYEHSAAENQAWIENYLNNPLETFFNDSELVFLKILSKIKENLEREGLDLKDSKREKTLEIVGSVDSEKLRGIQEREKQLVEEKSIVSKKIDNSAVYGKISDAKYKLEHFDAQIADLEQEIKELDDVFSKMNLENVKEQIKQKVFEVFRVKLEIV